jgi:hypothetical protein
VSRVFVAVLAWTVADASSLIDIGDRLIAEMMAAVPAPIKGDRCLSLLLLGRGAEPKPISGDPDSLTTCDGSALMNAWGCSRLPREAAAEASCPSSL